MGNKDHPLTSNIYYKIIIVISKLEEFSKKDLKSFYIDKNGSNIHRNVKRLKDLNLINLIDKRGNGIGRKTEYFSINWKEFSVLLYDLILNEINIKLNKFEYKVENEDIYFSNITFFKIFKKRYSYSEIFKKLKDENFKISITENIYFINILKKTFQSSLLKPIQNKFNSINELLYYLYKIIEETNFLDNSEYFSRKLFNGNSKELNFDEKFEKYISTLDESSQLYNYYLFLKLIQVYFNLGVYQDFEKSVYQNILDSNEFQGFLDKNYIENDDSKTL